MVISLLKKTRAASYFLTLLQFMSSAEQVLLLGVFGSSTNVCVSWDVRSEKAQQKEVTCVSMLSTPRGFSKGEFCEKREIKGGTSHQEVKFRMFSREHACQQERDSSPVESELILGTSLVIQRLQILRASLVIQWLRLPSFQSHRFDPWSGNYIPHATKSSNVATKDPQCCNKDLRLLMPQLRPGAAK